MCPSFTQNTLKRLQSLHPYPCRRKGQLRRPEERRRGAGECPWGTSGSTRCYRCAWPGRRSSRRPPWRRAGEGGRLSTDCRQRWPNCQAVRTGEYSWRLKEGRGAAARHWAGVGGKFGGRAALDGGGAENWTTVGLSLLKRKGE
jgi:hypothetical protein